MLNPGAPVPLSVDATRLLFCRGNLLLGFVRKLRLLSTSGSSGSVRPDLSHTIPRGRLGGGGGLCRTGGRAEECESASVTLLGPSLGRSGDITVRHGADYSDVVASAERACGTRLSAALLGPPAVGSESGVHSFTFISF